MLRKYEGCVWHRCCLEDQQKNESDEMSKQASAT